MSESVMPKFVSNKIYNQSPVTKSDLFSDDRRRQLLEAAVDEQRDNRESENGQHALMPEQEAQAQAFRKELDETDDIVEKVEGVAERGEILNEVRELADKYVGGKK